MVHMINSGAIIHSSMRPSKVERLLFLAGLRVLVNISCSLTGSDGMLALTTFFWFQTVTQAAHRHNVHICMFDFFA